MSEVSQRGCESPSLGVIKDVWPRPGQLALVTLPPEPGSPSHLSLSLVQWLLSFFTDPAPEQTLPLAAGVSCRPGVRVPLTSPAPRRGRCVLRSVPSHGAAPSAASPRLQHPCEPPASAGAPLPPAAAQGLLASPAGTGRRTKSAGGACGTSRRYRPAPCPGPASGAFCIYSRRGRAVPPASLARRRRPAPPAPEPRAAG